MTDSDRSALLGRLAFLLALFSLATIVMGLWLGWTSAIVLPRQDRARAEMWLMVAGGFIGYSGLCSAFLRSPSGAGWLRLFVIAASLVAIGLGLFGIYESLAVANSDRQFGGYRLFMGCVIVAHGACALAYAWVRGSGVIEERPN